MQMKDQLQEIKAEIRNKLQAPKAVLDLVSADKKVPENLLKMAHRDLDKVIELLRTIK